ncbi:MAG: hypothetical protein ACFCGT_26505 [Sandaracinaceae bacterium]
MSLRARSLLALGAVLLLGALSGCRGNGVGDPCLPEAIPEGGFDPNESQLETSSVQCRTRTCLVFQLEGDPEEICDPANPVPDCVAQAQVDARVFCSCRCSGAGDLNAPLCNCPNDFVCVEDLIGGGGGGVEGGYCVRCRCEGDGLDPDFPECDRCPGSS